MPRSQHRASSTNSNPNFSISERSSGSSAIWSENSSESEPSTPTTDPQSEHAANDLESKTAELDLTKSKSGNASTKLLTQDPAILKTATDEGSGTRLIQKYCCGGGCCFENKDLPPVQDSSLLTPLDLPNNDAFRSLDLKLGQFGLDTELTGISPLPDATIKLSPLAASQPSHISTAAHHPPRFVQPHPPYEVFSAPLFHARELTKPGAAKRTFHFDIDVTDYPEESGVDFKVGGAIGVCPPNSTEKVDELFDLLGVPTYLRDKPTTVDTTGGRWPTIWGDEQARSLPATRRELLTWCSDIQSYPPTKGLLRLLAEHATEPNEKKILLYLSSAQGQPAFCELRTGPHIAVSQLLHAFPSSKPPMDSLLAVLNQLMPRFYSLSNDPYVSSEREGLAGRRLIEIAVTVHETPNWRGGPRTGVGSGYLERVAHQFASAEQKHLTNGTPMPDFRIPMFRGLMANPLSKEFGSSNGPMMLIGAGVGMAPFRGFILNRLRNANCASKIWLVQGVRDSQVDELYSGELGRYEAQIKTVVQSRKKTPTRKVIDALPKNFSETDLTALKAQAAAKIEAAQTDSKYVQDEVRAQAGVVWDVINHVDGRVFVCGSSAGMGEGVEAALRDVAIEKGGLSADEASEFWARMKEGGKYIAETW